MTDWNPKKTNAEKIAIQMYLLKSFFTSKAGMLLHELDKKNMEDFTNLLRDKYVSGVEASNGGRVIKRTVQSNT